MEILHFFCPAAPDCANQGGRFALSSLLMICLCALDILTPAEIRLHVLYVFPLAIIAYHCTRSWMPAFGLLLSISLQLFTFVVQHGSDAAMVVDALVATASSLLTIVLAQHLRSNYIALNKLADTDPLTELCNRRSFDTAVEREIKRQIRHGGWFSIVAIDLNDFKKLNDVAGHHAGDRALILLSKILLKYTRGTDTVARLGGDEFAILMPWLQENDGDIVCQKLTLDIDRELAAGGFSVTASIGFATFHHAPSSTSVAMQTADQSMYRRKALCKAGAVAIHRDSGDVKAASNRQCLKV